MNRRQFLMGTAAIAVTAALPEGLILKNRSLGMSTLVAEGLTIDDVLRLRNTLERHAIKPIDGHYTMHLSTGEQRRFVL